MGRRPAHRSAGRLTTSAGRGGDLRTVCLSASPRSRQRRGLPTRIPRERVPDPGADGERDRALAKTPWITEVRAIPIIEERRLVEELVTAALKPRLEQHRLLL